MKLKPLVIASLVALTSLSSHAANINQNWGVLDFESTGKVSKSMGSFLDTYTFTLGGESVVDATFLSKGINFGSYSLFDETGTISLFGTSFGGQFSNANTWSLDAGTYIFAIGGKAGSAASYSLAASTTPVPEPETYAMLLAGLGIIGFVARRRRSV